MSGTSENRDMAFSCIREIDFSISFEAKDKAISFLSLHKSASSYAFFPVPSLSVIMDKPPSFQEEKKKFTGDSENEKKDNSSYEFP